MFEKTYVLGALNKCLPETFPYHTQNICLIGKKLIKIIFGVINTFMSTYLKVPIIPITDKSK